MRAIPEIHISSLVVQASPSFVTKVISKVDAIPEAEISNYSPDEGKIIVLLETENSQQITDLIADIHKIEHVATTSMVYHQIIADESQTIPLRHSLEQETL